MLGVAAFMTQFPDVATTAAAGQPAVIAAWDRLGYPPGPLALGRRGLRHAHGWPEDLRALPGIGRYTARRDRGPGRRHRHRGHRGEHPPGVQARAGRRLSEREAELEAAAIAAPLRGRDRACCADGPRRDRGTARQPRANGARSPAGARPQRARGRDPSPSGKVRGSFRQRRGRVMAELRVHDQVAVADLDREALDALRVRRPRRDHRRTRTSRGALNRALRARHHTTLRRGPGSCAASRARRRSGSTPGGTARLRSGTPDGAGPSPGRRPIRP